MNQLPSKARIRQAFDKAALSYDNAARVQRWIATRLIGGLPAALVPAVILDAGCGTGFAQEMFSLRFPAARCIAMDFSIPMLSRIARPEFALVGDVERLPLKNAVAGLYWSNFTAQWCAQEKLLEEAFRVLWPSGTLALSTLGIGTFQELVRAFSQVDDYRHTLAFTTPETLRGALALAGFTGARIQVETCVLHYPDLKSLMRSIKSVGANQIPRERRRQGLMGKSAWRKLEAAYEELRVPKGLPLTYEVILCYASKPA